MNKVRDRRNIARRLLEEKEKRLCKRWSTEFEKGTNWQIYPCVEWY